MSSGISLESQEEDNQERVFLTISMVCITLIFFMVLMIFIAVYGFEFVAIVYGVTISIVVAIYGLKMWAENCARRGYTPIE